MCVCVHACVSACVCVVTEITLLVAFLSQSSAYLTVQSRMFMCQRSVWLVVILIMPIFVWVVMNLLFRCFCSFHANIFSGRTRERDRDGNREGGKKETERGREGEGER